MLHYVAAYDHSIDDGFFGGLLANSSKRTMETSS